MKNIYFDDFEDFACTVADTYDALDYDEEDVAIIAKYEEARQIIKELLCLGYDLHSIDIDDRICHIRSQTILPENIHTGIAEAGHRIKHCPEKSGGKSILRNKHNSIGNRTHRLHQKSSAHDLTDHTDQTIHGIQIIVFRDQALRAHGQTPSQKQ